MAAHKINLYSFNGNTDIRKQKKASLAKTKEAYKTFENILPVNIYKNVCYLYVVMFFLNPHKVNSLNYA